MAELQLFYNALTLLHSEWPKLNGVLAILSAIGLLCCFTSTVNIYGHVGIVN